VAGSQERYEAGRDHIPCVIVQSIPSLHLRFSQRNENLPIEKFIPQFPVERLDVAVLPGAARFDENGLNTYSCQPFAYRLGSELGSIIGANMLRDPYLPY